MPFMPIFLASARKNKYQFLVNECRVIGQLVCSPILCLCLVYLYEGAFSASKIQCASAGHQTISTLAHRTHYSFSAWRSMRITLCTRGSSSLFRFLVRAPSWLPEESKIKSRRKVRGHSSLRHSLNSNGMVSRKSFDVSEV